MTTGYRIPASMAQVEIVRVNSRFIAAAGFASTVADAREFINAQRKLYPDAAHHVYAFRVGYGNSVQEGMSDDGEPSGTSAPPIMAVLRGSDLGDTVIVVTRYFGGTKLGTGGLVKAYGDSAKEVLAVLPTEVKIERATYELIVSYAFYGAATREIAAFEGEILSEDFAEGITLTVILPADQCDAFVATIINRSNGAVTPALKARG